MTDRELRKRGATIDWSARLRTGIESLNSDLRSYAMLASAGREDTAAEVYQRLARTAWELERTVLPNL